MLACRPWIGRVLSSARLSWANQVCIQDERSGLCQHDEAPVVQELYHRNDGGLQKLGVLAGSIPAARRDNMTNGGECLHRLVRRHLALPPTHRRSHLHT